MEALEDRQRVDRWIEESQYLIGRLIPGLLDDRERLKGKLEVAEQECARLRHEAAELRKEISDLQSETQYFRTEHVAMADALREVIEHVGQIHKPLNDVHRRLQVTQAEHKAIVAAIASGKTADAVAAMRLHIDNVTAEFIEFARKSPGLFADPERVNEDIYLLD